MKIQVIIRPICIMMKKTDEDGEEMLKPIKADEINAAAAFAARLFTAPENRSYPLLLTEAEIAPELLARAGDENACLLGCYDEKLAGLMSLFAVPENQYLQTTLLTTGSAAAYEAFLAHMEANYPGLEANVGVAAENVMAARALIDAGFTLAEASADMRLDRADFVRAAAAQIAVERVDAASFDEYARFHDAHFRDVYWSAARLRKKVKNWRIYALKRDGTLVGGLFMTARFNKNTAEIYGMAVEEGGAELAAALLSQALCAAFEEDAALDAVIFFVDENEPENLRAAASCGFIRRGGYRLYTKRL